MSSLDRFSKRLAENQGQTMNDSFFIRLLSLKEHDHLCHLYFNDTERFEIGANFLIHGIKNREKCIYISDKILPKELIERLTGSGVNIDKARKERHLEEITIGIHSEKTREPHSFVRFIKQSLEAYLDSKTKLLRILISNKEVYSNSDADFAWEKASLNKICFEKPIILMNQFEIGRIGPVDLVNIFKTHPMIILEGLVYESPFYVPPDKIMAKLQSESDKFRTLTSKEKRILRYIVNGYSSKSIAKELSISIKTVETHRVRIMRKLDIHKLVDLVKFAMKNRLT
jgi:DNA-binding CsgD family transcriptional regulator